MAQREALSFSLHANQLTLARLDKLLKTLPDKIARKVLASASNKAMKVVEKAAKQNAPNRFGVFRKAIGRRQKRYGRSGVIYTVLGVRSGFKTRIGTDKSGFPVYENPINIAHLIERGTDPHLITPKGQKGALKIKRGRGPTQYVHGAIHHPGSKAFRFMTKAIDNNKWTLFKTLADEVGKGVQTQLAKLSWSRTG